ncbi:MAG: hypothetical protein C0473_00405 [Cyanobacteria bacterium DS3.002]|nr:hypothetical protein [Cyanobacteria bacterium DS3.002]MBA4050090.1 hypothetical protein [Cyanobacteria bacterium DS2.008]MBA4076859.1 hypothetical protein [Cyanobacteria bacterium PR.023]
MLEASEKIKEALREKAHDASRPFCYSDYMTVEENEDGEFRCPKCGSDDLMREVEGVGVEWGYDWVIDHLVAAEGEQVNIEELYRDLLDEVYEPIKFGELEYCPSQVLEAVDPTAFRMGCNDYTDSLMQDDQLVYLNGNYYRVDSLV